MIERAASYVVRNGPVTGEDRWEEDAGYSPFTLAVEIAALLAAADMFETCGKAKPANYLRETADCWNDQIERWTYVTGTPLGKEVGVEGYYVRIAPPDTAGAASPKDGFVPIKNRPPGDSEPAGRGDRQPGCAGARPLRPQGRRRSAHPRHGQGDRRAAALRPAAGACLVSLYR